MIDRLIARYVHPAEYGVPLLLDPEQRPLDVPERVPVLGTPASSPRDVHRQVQLRGQLGTDDIWSVSPGDLVPEGLRLPDRRSSATADRRDRLGDRRDGLGARDPDAPPMKPPRPARGRRSTSASRRVGTTARGRAASCGYSTRRSWVARSPSATSTSARSPATPPDARLHPVRGSSSTSGAETSPARCGPSTSARPMHVQSSRPQRLVRRPDAGSNRVSAASASGGRVRLLQDRVPTMTFRRPRRAPPTRPDVPVLGTQPSPS